MAKKRQGEDEDHERDEMPSSKMKMQDTSEENKPDECNLGATQGNYFFSLARNIVQSEDYVGPRIEDFPKEILAKIFKMISNVDAENCLKACEKWRDLIIHYIFGPYLCKIVRNNLPLRNTLIDEGWTEDCEDYDLIISLYKRFKSCKALVLITGAHMHHEIIDLSDPNNDSFIFITPPMFDDKPVGGLLRNKPVVCGYGKGEDGCFIFNQPMRRTLPRPLGFGAYSESQNMVIPSRSSMLEKRNHASSVVLNDTTLWVVGGINDYPSCINVLNSTELIKLNEPPKRGPRLPFTIYAHGMIKFKENCIFIIGGIQDALHSDASKNTWIVDPTNSFKIRKGPSLNKERSHFSCGKMDQNGKTIFVVAGGRDCFGKVLNSVELLDPSSNDSSWIHGPNLPFPLDSSAMVTSPNGQGVMVLGGSSLSHQIFELKSRIMIWSRLNQTLQYGRNSHVALPISDMSFIRKWN